MAFGCWLNIRKNGTTYRVPCYSAVAEASPSGCPCFCVRYNNATYYASVSASSTYAVATFRYNNAPFYLVTQQSAVVRWMEIMRFTDAGTYTLPAAYQRMPIRVAVQSSNGEAGTAGTTRSVTVTKFLGCSHTSTYSITSIGGAGGTGGQGHWDSTCFYSGFATGYVFYCTRYDGETAGGSGGRGFSLAGVSARGGGGGGNGGTGGEIKIDNNNFSNVEYKIYAGGTGYSGGDGTTSGYAGSAGTSVGWTAPTANTSYTTGGRGGNGGGGNSSSTVAYAAIQVGYVR